MEGTKVNILLIGNSGSGKSTLINAIFNKDIAVTGNFGGGKTQRLKMYSNEDLNYRIIDTKGLELGWLEQRDTLKQVSNYINETIKEGDLDAAVDIVWYCIDAGGKRFFKENINQILQVYKKFPNIPVVIVLTKSVCSLEEQKENEKLIRRTIEEHDRKEKIKLVDVIAVNSISYTTMHHDVIEIFGIDELINRTNEIIPVAKRTSEENMQIGRRALKNKQANITVSACAVSAVAVGAVPIPFADAAVLTVLQTGMVKAIASIYGIESSIAATAIIEASIVSNTAKLTLSALKSIPGLNIGAAVLNGIVAGVFTVTIGEVSILVCEKLLTKELDMSEINEFAKEKIPAAFDAMFPYLQKMLNENGKKGMDVSGAKRLISNLMSFKKKKRDELQ